MTERLKTKNDDALEELRMLVFNRALELTKPLPGIRPGDTSRYAELFPYGEDDEFSYRIYAYKEGEQDDGTIVQLSFNDYDVDEAHLEIKDQGMTYEENASDGSNIAKSEVSQEMARQLLERLEAKLK